MHSRSIRNEEWIKNRKCHLRLDSLSFNVHVTPYHVGCVAFQTKSSKLSNASIDHDPFFRIDHRAFKGYQEAMEIIEPKMRSNSARKRKSDDIVDIGLDEPSTGPPDFSSRDHVVKPTILNSRDAFFDKNNSSFSSQLTDSPVESSVEVERVIRTAKSFIDDDHHAARPSSNIRSPLRSPRHFRRDSSSKHSFDSSNVGTPCGVIDELFSEMYACMPSWECSLPWREDDDESDNEDHLHGIVRRDAVRHDAKDLREHLSFPKHLGKEYVLPAGDDLERKNKSIHRTIRRSSSSSQRAREGSSEELNNMNVNRAIRRSPSSRLTTLESDSRQKLPGSKMIRRTEINRVTEIHWDEEVLDAKTLEQMAKLSVY